MRSRARRRERCKKERTTIEAPTTSAESTAISTAAAASASSTRRTSATSSSSTAAAPLLGAREAVDGQEFGGIDEDLLVGLEGGRLHAVTHFHGEALQAEHNSNEKKEKQTNVFLRTAEDLVDLADLLLVLEVDGRVEEGDLAARRPANQIVLAAVGEVADF